ncbi:MAG: hypothetical protein M1570_06195 [Chloroflexi bacterium]|nr:hypothetical protein [Chloroflexota bacterium]
MVVRAAPLLVGGMVGGLIGLVAWGYRRSRESEAGMEVRDDVLLGFTLLAALALATFVVYLFLLLVS